MTVDAISLPRIYAYYAKFYGGETFSFPIASFRYLCYEIQKRKNGY